MFAYGKAVAVLLAIMCMVRFGVAAFSYLAPEETFAMFNLRWEPQSLLHYFVRTWAIRDIVIAGLVVCSNRFTIKPLLMGCIVIELSDILSTWLSVSANVFTAEEAASQVATAFIALGAEALALFLIIRRERISAE